MPPHNRMPSSRTKYDNVSRFSVDVGGGSPTLARMRRVFFLGFLALSGGLADEEITLLNPSSDRRREFYAEFEEAFAKNGKEKTGDTVTVNQSHGGNFGDGGTFNLLHQPVGAPR